MDNENRRKHPRYPMKVEVRIQHPDIGEKVVKTRNVSDGGVFLLVEPEIMPPIGEVVQAQVQGVIENPPIVQMEIVRVEADGLGLQFREEPEGGL